MSESEVKGRKLGATVYRYRTGIVIGGLFGLMTGGLPGLLFGGFIGFMLQRALAAKVMAALNPQKLFFEATFSVMGKVAKADGRVTEQEITYAREVMNRMNLSEEKRREAISLFSKGKEADYDIGSTLAPLARLIRFRPEVKQMFVEIQLQAAFADGQVSQAELMVVQDVCSTLQISYQDLQQILHRCRAEQAFNQQSYYGHQAGHVNEAELLKEAYGVLGVDENVEDAELKRAYRKLMSQHHPDKLIAKGLPEEMMQLAKEKTQELQAAYDRIREYRKRNR
ncbi:co-chaperone DjlA [Motiliproteus sp. MSK22-1]|uniref:co-chaperone DjlA n=1 Tax=Motiliproteus sp. MSK22-1 TaxID=1897630 RepID=UPI000977F859|nr:co-chaperone DjlA [Motiliproteus sp. MSK22-1]OMH32162.1 molecular chaperone DjlA [Motiliproteus sp. MSK22-1]